MRSLNKVLANIQASICISLHARCRRETIFHLVIRLSKKCPSVGLIRLSIERKKGNILFGTIAFDVNTQKSYNSQTVCVQFYISPKSSAQHLQSSDGRRFDPNLVPTSHPRCRKVLAEKEFWSQQPNQKVEADENPRCSSRNVQQSFIFPRWCTKNRLK